MKKLSTQTHQVIYHAKDKILISSISIFLAAANTGLLWILLLSTDFSL